MADLRSRFIEDYAGGLLNVSRQELNSTGEVLSQDGLLSDLALFVEDGTGTKSGLKLGKSICEVVDPTTEEGAVNVRYADRTYASIRDLKIFSTAIASAQAALSDASSSSISNLENAFVLLEESQKTTEAEIENKLSSFDSKLESVETLLGINTANSLSLRVESLEASKDSQEKDLNRLDEVIKNIGLLKKLQLGVGVIQEVDEVSYYESEPDSGRNSGTISVTNLFSSTSTGSGLDLDITVSNTGEITSINVTNGGTGFNLGDTIVVQGSSLGGSVDLIVEVTKLGISSSEIGSTQADINVLLINEIQDLIVKVNDIIKSSRIIN